MRFKVRRVIRDQVKVLTSTYLLPIEKCPRYAYSHLNGYNDTLGPQCHGCLTSTNWAGIKIGFRSSSLDRNHVEWRMPCGTQITARQDIYWAAL